MTRPLLVVRPEPGASATAALAAAQGFAVVVVVPLFAVRALNWSPPAARPQAVLMTSANAARHGGSALAGLTDLPLYAVGAATAAAAREAGFVRIVAGGDGVDAIVARAAQDGVTRLLHLAGRDHRAPADAGIAIDRRLVYAADAVASLPAPIAAARDAVALLHSPRAAALLASLADRGTLSIAAISEATRDAAGDGWRAVAVAARPTDASLLAAAAKLCDHHGAWR